MECNDGDGDDIKWIEIENHVQSPIHSTSNNAPTGYDENLQKIHELEAETRELRTQLESFAPGSLQPDKIAHSKRCEICSATMSQREFGQHLCLNETSIACEYCIDVEFTSTLELREHLLNSIHSQVTFYRCNKCILAFPMRKLLEIHESSNHAQFMAVSNPLNGKPMDKCE